MAYIVQRNDRFFVVDYDGIDAHTGKERRRWHPVGRSRVDAEEIAATLTTQRDQRHAGPATALTVATFLLEHWLPRRRRELRPSTARRYEWYITHYLIPAIGEHRLANLRAEHLDRLYADLIDHGGINRGPLAAKTVYDAHVVIRCALRYATSRHLIDHNVALDANPPRSTQRSRPAPQVWTADQLATFLHDTAHLRLHPALYLAATTGMRRGELAGLRWGDWNRTTHRLSIARSRQASRGGTIEVPTKTTASRRCIDLDATTEHALTRWHRHLHTEGHSTAPGDPMFTNTAGQPLNPESLSQLFDRHITSSGLPRIRVTTCATPTPHSSSPPASRSKSSPSDSATPTPASPWPPTNTYFPA